MLYYKQIQLKPAHDSWVVDVIVCEDLEHRKQFYQDKYGWHVDSLGELDGNDFVTDVCGKKGSTIDGRMRIVLNLSNLNDKQIMVHEITHVLFYAQKFIGLNVNWESQEWCACFMEMLWVELNKPNYEKIKPKK